MKVLFMCALLALVAVVWGMPRAPTMSARYDGFKVYRVFVKDSVQLAELTKIHNYIPLRMLDGIHGAQQSYDVVVAPEYQTDIETVFDYLDFEYNIVMEDLQSVLDLSIFDKHSKMDWITYHSLDAIYSWLDEQCAKHAYLECGIIGHSYEGRPIKSLKLSKRAGNKALFIEGNMHAMEWISSATVTYILNELLNSNDAQIQQLTESYDWIFVPMVNPDGYAYTQDVERLWRKNRRPTGYRNTTDICFGIDMNRNFDYHWAEAGWNVDEPCDHWFAGVKPNTEEEIRVLQKFVNSFEAGYIRSYMAFHAYGQYILLPYGHTDTEFPPNYEQMMRISAAFAEEAIKPFGSNFTYGASGLLNYAVSGSSKDWAYGVKNITFTCTVELRDKGTYGFFLPSDQITEVGIEVMAGMKGLVLKADEEGIFD